MPGAGLRQAQPSSGPCGHTCQTSNGPSSVVDPAVDGVDLVAVQQPARDPGLVGHDADRYARRAQPGQGARAVGTGVTCAGSAQYGTSTTSVPSRSKQHRARAARFGRRAADGAEDDA